MSYSLASASVSATGVPATYKLTTTHKKNATENDAIDIGNLSEADKSSSSTAVQGTSLQVSSRLTGSNATEYYTFDLSGSNIKLDYRAENANTRVILRDSNGKIVADSHGKRSQRANYISLMSGSGLSASNGNYTMEVTYAKGANTTKDIDYSFKLYSGDSYSAVYKNIVKAHDYDDSAYGSVTATIDAELYTASAYNKINAKVSDAINIGWMKQDKSMLDVYSQLTKDDNVEYYSFTFEEGDNLKFGFKKGVTRDSSQLRVQLLDRSGSYVYADSEGTEAQRKAYKELTSGTGMDARPGSYVIKISYAADVTKRTDQIYEFGIFSGSTYSAEYKTTASAQTYANALLLGQISGTSTSTAIAAYLTAQMNKDDDYSTSALSSALKSLY